MAPRFSIITAVFNPPISAFKACCHSVLQQSNHDWEWILVDDGSTSEEVLNELSDLSRQDNRIRVIFRPTNGGIVEASNDAINQATGQFLVFLDHDDQLTSNALAINSDVIENNPEIDYLYSDEAKIDDNGRIWDEFAKPDWSPERLRGQNYCSHLSVMRTDLVREVGPLRKEFEGSQDYDLILRVTEKARAIAHIAEILYLWRTVEGSTASDPNAKPYALVAAQKAVQAHLDRVGITATVEMTPELYLRVNRNSQSRPKVSIIIPTCGTEGRTWGRDHVLVETAVASIIQRSTYSNYEIVVVYDTPRTPLDTITNLQKIGGDRLRLVPYNRPFNFSEKCNLGVVNSDGGVIILLNDDTQIHSPNWIEGLVCYFDEPDMGMTGPMLLSEDGRIQSAGHHFDIGAHNYGSGFSSRENGPMSVLTIAAERSGLTMACVAIPRGVYESLGGSSEVYPRAFNDVDFGNKLAQAKYRMVWNPQIQVHHFESLSRDPKVEYEEVEDLWDRWGNVVLRRDSYLPHVNIVL